MVQGFTSILDNEMIILVSEIQLETLRVLSLDLPLARLKKHMSNLIIGERNYSMLILLVYTQVYSYTCSHNGDIF